MIFAMSILLNQWIEILKRLNTEYLGYFTSSRPDPLGEPEEVARAFDLLYQSGKVRHFGVSNHNGSQIASFCKSILIRKSLPIR